MNKTYGWTVEVFDHDDEHPDWKPEIIFFHHRENALKWVENENARLLSFKQKLEERRYLYALKCWEDQEVLFKAGRLPSPGKKPERRVVTELGKWDRRYMLVPIEWEDQP